MSESAHPAPPGLSTCEAEQLAHELGGDVAFLRAAQGVFFARGESWPPLSPVLRLLRGLYELEPRRARFIARNRIHSTRPASPTCAGATRVAARHMRAGVRSADHGPRVLDGLPRIDAGAAVPSPRRADPQLEPALSGLVDGCRLASDRERLELAVRLAGEMRRQAALLPTDGRVDNAVAALLVDEAGDVLGWAANTGSRNATSHAEVNLVENWLEGAQRLLPRGCRVYATLKPCKMCAGLLWDSAEDPSQLQVFFAEDDPLRYARETVLDARSMARRLVSRDAGDLARVAQERLSL